MGRDAATAHQSSDHFRAQGHDRIGSDDFAMATMMDLEAAAHQPSPNPAVDITASQKMISAMSGSLLTSLLVTPLDVVRVRLQSQKSPTPLNYTKLPMSATSLTPIQTAELGVTTCCREVFFAGNSAEYCLAGPRIETIASGTSSTLPADCAVEEVNKKTYRSTYDGLRKIARNEGFTTLWRGLSPTLLMTIPANIIYFTGYDWLRYNKTSPLSMLSPDSAPLVAGAVARILAATAVGPIELFRTRMQAASNTSTTNHMMETFKGVKEMVNAHGYTTMWRGLTLTLWRDVPFSGLYWWGYETIRAGLTDWREQRRGRPLSRDRSDRAEARRRSQSAENHRDTFTDSFAAGALSGALASLVTTPFDVGKTRTQVYSEVSSRVAGSESKASQAAPEQRHMVRLLWHIFKTEGIPGLWRGWIPRLLKVAPACAIMISSYEVGKTAFRGVNERKATDDVANV